MNKLKAICNYSNLKLEHVCSLQFIQIIYALVFKLRDNLVENENDFKI